MTTQYKVLKKKMWWRSLIAYSLIVTFYSYVESTTVEDEVRQHYEELPYPSLESSLDSVSKITKEGKYLIHFHQLNTCKDRSYRIESINHNLFNGKLSLDKEFRALIAGGGTGEETVTLAQDMKIYNMKGEVVHLDISNASIQVAKRWTESLQLDNVKFVLGSIYDVEKLNLGGEFDYIECGGVLHHLEDPLLGLVKLRSVLKKEGGMALMVYGKYGRSGVYEMQRALKMVIGDEVPIKERVPLARKWMEYAPPSSLIKSNPRFATAHLHFEDEEFYDVFLHSKDIPFTVPEIVEWVTKSNLSIVDFFPTAIYEPLSAIPTLPSADMEPELHRKLNRMKKWKRYEFTELITGTIAKHYFYVVRDDREGRAVPVLEEDWDQVPCIHQRILDHTKFTDVPFDKKVTLNFSFEENSVKLQFPSLSALFSDVIDCKRSIRDVFEEVKKRKIVDVDKKKKKITWQLFEGQFRNFYESMRAMGAITLHSSTSSVQQPPSFTHDDAIQ